MFTLKICHAKPFFVLLLTQCVIMLHLCPFLLQYAYLLPSAHTLLISTGQTGQSNQVQHSQHPTTFKAYLTAVDSIENKRVNNFFDFFVQANTNIQSLVTMVNILKNRASQVVQLQNGSDFEWHQKTGHNVCFQDTFSAHFIEWHPKKDKKSSLGHFSANFIEWHLKTGQKSNLKTNQFGFPMASKNWTESWFFQML